MGGGPPQTTSCWLKGPQGDTESWRMRAGGAGGSRNRDHGGGSHQDSGTPPPPLPPTVRTAWEGGRLVGPCPPHPRAQGSELGAGWGCCLSVPFTHSCVIHRVGRWPREKSREEGQQRADQPVPRAEVSARARGSRGRRSFLFSSL